MSDELVTLETVVGSLPDPVEFRRRALEAARAGYAALADGQEVHSPEDTFHVQRMLTRTRELAKQFASTFTAVDRELAGFQRDQLELLPGGPTAVRVPDAEGDVVVQLDKANIYTFDEGQLLTAVAASVLDQTTIDRVVDLVESAESSEAQAAAVQDMLAVLVVAAVEQVSALGKLGLQVTKVRAFADQLARDGALGLSGVVRDAIIKDTTTKGVKYDRKEST